MASVGGASIDDGMDNVELTQSQDTGYRRYRDLPHRSFNETLKTHSSFAVKLSETGESSLFVYETPLFYSYKEVCSITFFSYAALAGWLASCSLSTALCSTVQYRVDILVYVLALT